MRKVLVVIGVIIVILLLVAAALPFVFNADKFRPRVEAEATKALGRDVKLGKLSLSLFSGGVRADQLSVADDPAYSKQPFVTAKSMTMGVDIVPLIFSQKLNVRSFTIDSPDVRLVQGTNGKWNVSTLGAKKQTTESSGTPNLTVGKFEIRDGKLHIEHLGSRAKPVTYDALRVDATDIAPKAAFPYSASMQQPGGGSINVKGKFGPLNEKDTGQTPLTAEFKIAKFDIANSGLLDPDSAIRGLADLDGSLDSNGRTAKLQARGSADKLALVAGGVPAKSRVGLELATDYDLVRQAGDLRNTKLKVGNSAADIGGTYDMSGTRPRVNLNVLANNAAVADIEGLLPALGIVLPSGASLQGGTASAKATIAGPVGALVTNGNISLANTKLTGYDLGQQLSAVAKLAGIQAGRETNIQVFASNLHIAPEGMRADNINLVAPGLGTLTGAGTIGPHNELDFKMRAKLEGTSGNLVGALSQAAGLGQRNADIPFKVSGTTSNPVFMPDVGGTVGGMMTQQQGQQGQGGLLESIGGLFGKKKKQ